MLNTKKNVQMKNQDFLTDLYGKVLHALLPLRSILKFVNRDVLQHNFSNFSVVYRSTQRKCQNLKMRSIQVK